MFKTIEEHVEAIIIEKKSKFIANIFYIESEKEAEDILAKIKKKYYDARHNCYAYRVKNNDLVIQKQSDDGEPSGTAGNPMLNILEKKELVNVLIIVTRYFGGILLGTGGLVKAYSDATIKAIENTNQIEKEYGYIVELTAGYDECEKIEYLCKSNNINIIQKNYLEKVNITIEISKEKYYEYIQKNKKIYFQNMATKIKGEKYIKLQ